MEFKAQLPRIFPRTLRIFFTISALTGELKLTITRDMLRDAYLKPYFHPDQFTVKTQWTVFPLFLFLFVTGAVLWFVMLKRYGLFDGAKAAQETSVETPVLTRAAR